MNAVVLKLWFGTLYTLMHLSIVCPTSPCAGIGGAKGGFDCEVYFNPAPWGFTEGSIPHFKGGSYVGNMGGFDTSS